MSDRKRSYDIVGACDGESQSSGRSASLERRGFQRSEAGNGEMTETLKRYRRGAVFMSPHQEFEWLNTAQSSHHDEESLEQYEYPTMWPGGSSGGEGGRDSHPWYHRNQGHYGDQSSSGSESNRDTASQHDEREKTIEEFQKDYNTYMGEHESNKGYFSVETKAKNSTEMYQNAIDINNGKIIGFNNKREKINNKWHFSDIVYMQLRLVLQKAGMDISQFDLKSWYGQGIIEKQTVNVAFDMLQGKQKVTVRIGTEEFNRLLDTPTQKSKNYLLNDHLEDFPEKQLISMKIIWKGNSVIDINNKYGSYP